MKSLASGEIDSNATSSKSQMAFVTLLQVSWLSSPANGERPLILEQTEFAFNGVSHLSKISLKHYFHGVVCKSVLDLAEACTQIFSKDK